MENLNLSATVWQMAQTFQAFTDTDLSQPFTWGPHADEGARFALLGTLHELRDLAATLATERATNGRSPSRAQRILSQYIAAYYDLQAVLLGISEETYNKRPAAAEWPLRYVVGHMVGTQRHFFTLVHYGLARLRNGAADQPAQLPDDETNRVTVPYAEFADIMENKPMADMLTYFQALHQRTLAEFTGIQDAELEAISVWWEQIEYPLTHRLHRMEAHLRQHTVQAEKNRTALGKHPNEAQRLLRLMLNALAELEGVLLGEPELGLDKQQALAVILAARTAEVQKIVADTRALVTAVPQNDIATVSRILAENPQLSGTLNEDGLSLILLALYRGHQGVVEALLANKPALSIWDAAAVGDTARLQAYADEWPGWLDEYNRDGFTPLQLAAYFGHTEAAQMMIALGVNIHAVSKNKDALTALHAAAARGNLAIMTALLEKGADVNACQTGQFTALHQAAHRGDVPMTQLLLKHNADRTLRNEAGQTALAIAEADGQTAVAALLR